MDHSVFYCLLFKYFDKNKNKTKQKVPPPKKKRRKEKEEIKNRKQEVNGLQSSPKKQ